VEKNVMGDFVEIVSHLERKETMLIKTEKQDSGDRINEQN